MLWYLNNAITDYLGVRVVVILIEAAVAGAASMLLYRWCSPQQKMQHIKQALADVQQRMNRYEGEFSGLWTLIQENLRLARKQVWFSLGPSLLAGIPVILLAVNLDAVHRKLTPPPPMAGSSAIIQDQSDSQVTAVALTVTDRVSREMATFAEAEPESAGGLEYLPVGPDWMRSWVAMFLVGCTVSACGVRYAQGTV
jgi:hypothetical protein